MRSALCVLLLAGCLVPESSTFVKLDDRYVPAPTENDVEIYIDSPPPRRFRVVGTIRVGYISNEGAEPIIAAKRARKYGCDLVTTQLDGAVAVTSPAPEPLFRRASWSGSSGSSGRSSGGGYSGGGGGGGGGTTSAPVTPRLFYCGIYVEPPPAPAPVPDAEPEVIRSSLM